MGINGMCGCCFHVGDGVLVWRICSHRKERGVGLFVRECSTFIVGESGRK